MHWLLLRGLGRQAGHWLDFPKHLGAARPGDTITCLDLPGVGAMRDRPSPLDIPAYVADLRERWLESRQETSGPAGIVAVSLGGMVALEWLARHPQDFSRGVIVNTSARDLGRLWHRMNIWLLPGLVRAGLSRSVRRREEAFVAATINLGDRPASVEAFLAIDAGAPLKVRSLLRQLGAAARYRLPDKIDVPVLVVSSAGDRLVDPRCSTRLAQRLGSAHAVHPSAGHDLPLDAPEWLSARIAEFAAS